MNADLLNIYLHSTNIQNSTYVMTRTFYCLNFFILLLRFNTQYIYIYILVKDDNIKKAKQQKKSQDIS